MLRILGLAARRNAITRGYLGGRDDGGNQVRSCVRGDVEDRVDAVWEHRERILRHEEPHDGHH